MWVCDVGGDKIGLKDTILASVAPIGAMAATTLASVVLASCGPLLAFVTRLLLVSSNR